MIKTIKILKIEQIHSIHLIIIFKKRHFIIEIFYHIFFQNMESLYF